MKNLVSEEMFKRLVQQSLFPRTTFSLPPHSANDWELVYRQAVSQALIGQLYPVVSELPASCRPERSLLLHWCGMATKITRMNERINRVFTEIIQCFNAEGIRTFILKGPFVSQFYRSGSLRQPGDIDFFFVTESDYLRACAWGKTHGSHYSRSVKHTAFEFRSVHIELHPEVEHWAYFPDRYALRNFFRNQAQHLAEYSLQMTNPVRYYSLAFQANIVYMLMHLAGHTLTSGVGLKQYVDLCCYCHSHEALTRPEKQALTTFLSYVGLLPFAEHVAILLTDYLGLSPAQLPYLIRYEAKVSILIEDVLHGGNFGINHMRKQSSSVSTFVHKCQTARKMIVRCIAYYQLFPAQALCFPLYYLQRNACNYWQEK